jgi:aldehyde dehydrogenase (NAD+)
LYVFSNDRVVRERILREISFGGGCVNDAVMQIANGRLPFGGVGESGLGSYHGEAGFRAFSHYKSIVERSLWPEFALKYSPRTARKLKLLRRLVGR